MTSVFESVRKQLPRSWTSTYTLAPNCPELSEYEEEYRTVKDKFCSTLSVPPKRIDRVESPQLFGMYLLKKAEYQEDVREKSLWHATSEENFANIIKTNLDWRRAERVKFGKGVSFSPSAEYANRECNRFNPPARVCILCKVLVRTSHGGSDTTTLPRQGYDTTTDIRGKVYVKYVDYEFYPEYAVYYDSPPYVPNRRFRWYL